MTIGTFQAKAAPMGSRRSLANYGDRTHKGADNRRILIAQITDTHVGFEPEAGDEEFNFVRFREVVGHLRIHPVPPDLLLLTGDITDGGQSDCYHRVRDLVSDCPFPVHVIPGNHDKRDALLRAFPDCPTADGFVQFALDLGVLRVLCLDTLEHERHGGAFCEIRAAWLARELAEHPDTPTLVFMHHPPPSSQGSSGWILAPKKHGSGASTKRWPGMAGSPVFWPGICIVRCIRPLRGYRSA